MKQKKVHKLDNVAKNQVVKKKVRMTNSIDKDLSLLHDLEARTIAREQMHDIEKVA